MATGQSVLNIVEDLFPEIQLQSGEADVAKGLRALNVSQDFLESVLALYPEVMGDTIGTVTTTASVEYTAFPTGLLRLDRLQYISPTNSLPAWDLDPIRQTGGHAFRRYYPLYITTVTTSGKPTGYWTNGFRIYWDPLPDATHTVRWYGLQAAADITASGTFLYPDTAMLPIASFATRYIRTGLDDDPTQLISIANETFGPLVQAMSSFRRDGPNRPQYRYSHET